MVYDENYKIGEKYKINMTNENIEKLYEAISPLLEKQQHPLPNKAMVTIKVSKGSIVIYVIDDK